MSQPEDNPLGKQPEEPSIPEAQTPDAIQPETEEVGEVAEVAEDIGGLAVEGATEPPEQPIDNDPGQPREVNAEDDFDKYLRDAGFEPADIERAKKILNADTDTLIKLHLEELGISEDELDETLQLVKASPVRLMITRLRELGLADSKADEAHRILISEKGRLRLKHIIDLGFDAEQAEKVHELLTSSPAKILRERLESMGIDEPQIDEIISVGDQPNKLTQDLLRDLGLSEENISALDIIRSKKDDTRELLRDLGYSDSEKINKAQGLGISSEAIEKAARHGYTIDLLLAAAERDPVDPDKLKDPGLHEWLAENGLDLPGPATEEVFVKPANSRREARKVRAGHSRVQDLYPPGNPNVITQSEVRYLIKRIEERPSWLSHSLIKAGSLPAPKWMYHHRLARVPLEIANKLYRPVGVRLLSRRIFRDYRSRHPNEDYGPTGYGQEQRQHIKDTIRATNNKIARIQRLLSLRQRHAMRGAIRANARLDLAQEVAEVRRGLMAFDMGREQLPNEREQYEQIRDNRLKNVEEHERQMKLEKLHPDWTAEEYKLLKNKPRLDVAEQRRYDELERLRA